MKYDALIKWQLIEFKKIARLQYRGFIKIKLDITRILCDSLHVKFRKSKIRNRYNQVPHLTQDTILQSDKTQENTTHKRTERLALYESASNIQDSTTKTNMKHKSLKRINHSYTPYHVYNYGFLFNCTMVGQASDAMTALTLNLNPWVGAWCMSLAGPKDST